MIGWECPKCGAVYGPQVQTCGRCTERTYAGTGNDSTAQIPPNCRCIVCSVVKSETSKSYGPALDSANDFHRKYLDEDDA